MGLETKRGKRGRGKGRKEPLANKPPVFENLRSPENKLTDWLALAFVTFRGLALCREETV